MDQSKTTQHSEHLRSLKMACNWVGISRGRASGYYKYIRELFDHDIRSREHILAFNESCEIVDIYELWQQRIGIFPGLNEKIRRVFKKGPSLSEDERPDTSSQNPRDHAFEYLVAGKLLRAKIKVIAVDGVMIAEGTDFDIGDVDTAFQWNGLIINIECKRPQSEPALKGKVKQAHKKLTVAPWRDHMGIIAVDCSVIIRQPGTLLEVDSPKQSHKALMMYLEKKIAEKLTMDLDSNILGFLVFARVPAMVRQKSRILSPRQKPITYYSLYSVSTFLCITNPSSTDSKNIFRSVCKRLSRVVPGLEKQIS
jgi:hypothetical protein